MRDEMDTQDSAIASVMNPLAPSLEEIEASIDRSLADIAAGRTVDGATALRDLRAFADAAIARMAAHGADLG